jgi:hypothetical protein
MSHNVVEETVDGTCLQYNYGIGVLGATRGHVLVHRQTVGHKHVHERVKRINLDLQRAPEPDKSLALAEHVVQASLHGGTTRRPGHGQ